MLPTALLVALALTPPLAAQCPQPTVPAGGFPLAALLSQPVSYLDGATSTLDIRYPSAAPPACGWPVILVVHSFTGSRRSVASFASDLARRGYFTVAHDVRGHGSAAANPSSQGCALVGRDERLDLVEIVQHVAANHAGLANVGRLGIMGISMGAGHAWASAAWSGKPLPPNPRGLTTFPTFNAACAAILAPYDAAWLFPQGRAAYFDAVDQFAAPTYRGVVWKDTFYTAMHGALAAENYAAMAAVFDADPFRQDLLHLQTSAVPVHVQVSWNDAFAPVEHAVDALSRLPAATPRRAILSAPGHGDAENDYQSQFIGYQTQRWFARFLRGEANGIDTEPHVTGVVPDSLAAYQQPSTLLWNRYTASWPPTGTATQRWYLRQGGQLATQAPTTVAPADLVVHAVPPGIGMAGLLASASRAAYVLGAIPLSTQSYTAPAAASDVEIAGSARAEIEVTPNARDYQLACSLWQVAASGSERFLQSGLALVRDDSTPQRLVVDFGDLRALLRAGDRLRLKLENLTVRQPLGVTHLHVVPYFSSAAIAVAHGVARVSFLDLPVMNQIQPALSLPVIDYPTPAPVDLGFTLASHGGLAGAPFAVLFGMSGIAPGIALPTGPMHLNLDALTSALAAQVNSPLLPSTAGFLDAAGNATPGPRFVLTALGNLSPLLGARICAVGLVLPTSGAVATNPVEWTFR